MGMAINSMRRNMTWANARIAKNIFCVVLSRVIGCCVIPCLIVVMWLAFNMELDLLQGLSVRTTIALMSSPSDERALMAARGMLKKSLFPPTRVDLVKTTVGWSGDLCSLYSTRTNVLETEGAACVAFASGLWNRTVSLLLNESRSSVEKEVIDICSLSRLQNQKTLSINAEKNVVRLDGAQTTCSLLRPDMLLLETYRSYPRGTASPSQSITIVLHGDDSDFNMWTTLVSAIRGFRQAENFSSLLANDREGSGFIAYAATTVGDLVSTQLEPIGELTRDPPSSGLLLLLVFVPTDLSTPKKFTQENPQLVEVTKISATERRVNGAHQLSYGWIENVASQVCVDDTACSQVSMTAALFLSHVLSIIAPIPK